MNAEYCNYDADADGMLAVFGFDQCIQNCRVSNLRTSEQRHGIGDVRPQRPCSNNG